MLTVGNFAILCACRPRTLRYYDRVGLLKPAQVDEWTGYRYYEESQLLDFRRIRSLQGAGFTIGEIRKLLHAPAEDVRAALRRKEAELKEKQRRLAELLKQGFPTEDMDMDKEIEEAKQAMQDLCEKLSAEDLVELGLEPTMLEPMKARLKEYWEDYFRGVFIRRPGERLEPTDTGWRREGWETIGEALKDLPELEGELRTYQLEISFRKPVNEVHVSVMIGAVLLRNPGKKLRLVVNMIPNIDKVNRIRLLRV